MVAVSARNTTQHDSAWGAGQRGCWREPIMIDPAEWYQWELGSETLEGRNRPTIISWLLLPVTSSIWAAIFIKQSSNLVLDVLYRAKVVYGPLRTLWNDFCLWAQERQQLEPWGVWSCAVGYEEPGEDPTWRMKCITNVQDSRNTNTRFRLGRTFVKW